VTGVTGGGRGNMGSRFAPGRGAVVAGGAGAGGHTGVAEGGGDPARGSVTGVARGGRGNMGRGLSDSLRPVMTGHASSWDHPRVIETGRDQEPVRCPNAVTGVARGGSRHMSCRFASSLDSIMTGGTGT